MNKFTKKLLSFALAASMLFGTAAMAANFTDMPTDWTAESVQKAIDNGLLGGYSDNTIRPNNNITRAQMATIISRCFNAESKADLSKFTDVVAGAWYCDAFAQAVDMGAFGGDNLNHLNPDKNITFQETFKVMSCIFGLIANTIPDHPQNDLTNQDLTVLNKFSDGDQVADWAKPYVAAIVENGYWSGIDGKLTPNSYITRAQFAVLMDNLVKTYITEPGEYTSLPEGNVLIKTDGVTIKADSFDSSIIIAESVTGSDKTDINITNLTGLLVIRGGADQVTFTGHLNKLAVIRKGISFNLNDTNLWGVKGYVIEGSSYNAGILPTN